MSEEFKISRSAASVKASIEGQLKQAKLKAFEGDLKKKVEELQAAEKIFRAKEQEVTEFMEQNSALFE